MKKLILITYLIVGFSNSALAVEFSKLTDDGSLCRAVIVDGSSKRANTLQGLTIYKNNVFLREVGLRNNVWQLPEEVLLTQNCDVVALYPLYDNGGGSVFQNVFINGKWVRDIKENK